MGIIKIPEPKLSENELRRRHEIIKTLDVKLEEYRKHFDDDFTTENLGMSSEEIIQNIEKCISNNHKWEGFIVPEIDINDLI